MWAYIAFMGLLLFCMIWFVYEYRKLKKAEERLIAQERLMREIRRKMDK